MSEVCIPETTAAWYCVSVIVAPDDEQAAPQSALRQTIERREQKTIELSA